MTRISVTRRTSSIAGGGKGAAGAGLDGRISRGRGLACGRIAISSTVSGGASTTRRRTGGSQGLPVLPHTPEHGPSRLGARGGLWRWPQLAPKIRILRGPPPGGRARIGHYRRDEPRAAAAQRRRLPAPAGAADRGDRARDRRGPYALPRPQQQLVILATPRGAVGGAARESS